MVRKQKGFTIIELVVVIVILGILAAVAFPRFQNLSGAAHTAVVNGAIAAFRSAAVITLASNQGTVPTAASVIAQVVPDPAFTFTGTCPNVTITYNPATGFNSTFSVDTSFCNG